jgi:hypothetical protein
MATCIHGWHWSGVGAHTCPQCNTQPSVAAPAPTITIPIDAEELEALRHVALCARDYP